MTACYVFVYGQEDISSDLTRENTSQLKSVSEYSQRGQWVAGSVDIPENTKRVTYFRDIYLQSRIEILGWEDSDL